MAETKNHENQEEKPDLTDAEKQKLLEKKYLDDLMSNPKYDNYFAPYNRSSVKVFKESLAREMANLELNGNMYIEQIEETESEYADTARKKLWEIQQRKLFDLQCRWRADLIKIPGIDISLEFDFWAGNIQHCPFIPPITQEEADRYLQYLISTDHEDIFDYYRHFSDWQDYSDLKQYYFNIDDDNVPEAPSWYEYYESVTGLSSLYLLPDIRGEKEEKYLAVSREHRQKLDGNKHRTSTFDSRPNYELYDDVGLIKFLKKFENFKTYYAFECHRKWQDINGYDELEEAVTLLKSADRDIYFDSSKKWRDSLLAAANNYFKQKVIEAFPGVFKNYTFMIENGLQLENETKREDFMVGLIKHQKEAILEGRELLGEPKDFNY